MVRQRLLGPVRLSLVAALLGALLVATAGVVSAAASITASPGTATLVPGTSGIFYIPFDSAALDIDVDCGAPSAQCSVWVARNNAAKATEALFTNVTGARALIPVAFINDGCFAFRLYDSAHAISLGQFIVGHGAPGINTTTVCNNDGTGRALVQLDGAGIYTAGGISGIFPRLSGMPTGQVRWDSGFTGGVEDSQIWVSQSVNAPFAAYTDCTAIAHPNANEVLYAQNVSGVKQASVPTGGGPYCFTLYQGTAHTTRTAGSAQLFFDPYLQYVGGTANGGLDPARGTIYFASGNGATNALVCVHGSAIPGSDVAHKQPFAFNSQGWNPGGTMASFQTAGAGLVKYTLYTNVGNLDANGAPTAASCGTGADSPSFFVHT